MDDMFVKTIGNPKGLMTLHQGCQGWARSLPELPHHGYTNGPASAHLGTGYTPNLPTFYGGKKLGN
jgi:hypothetical protein